MKRDGESIMSVQCSHVMSVDLAQISLTAEIE